MIQKRGDKFVVTDKAGTKVLGTHSSESKAKQQLAAIEISKAKHMKENKTFKAFRSTLTESEYSEVLTGYGNRSAHKDDAGLHHLQSAGALAGINAMLATIGKGTYLDPNEAFLKMKVRLNVVQLDFDWKPRSWDGGVGSYDIPVVQFGRVDGYDALTGQIRFDGKANPTGGYTQLNLHVDVELTPESLYVVTAKLTPAAPVAESVEVAEDLQTPAREREMKRKIDKADASAQRAYETRMTKTGTVASRASKQEDKQERKLVRLLKRDTKEYESPYLYGRGGKIVKRKGKPVREETEQITEAGAAKLARMGYAYDRARIGSRGVNNPERKQQMRDAYYKQREKVEASKAKRVAAGTFDKGRELEAHKKRLDVIAAKRAAGKAGKDQVRVAEALVGGQKKLDVNKNKRLDAQDFALLRAKKKPVQEAKIKKTILTQKVQDGKKIGSPRPIAKYEGK